MAPAADAVSDAPLDPSQPAPNVTPNVTVLTRKATTEPTKYLAILRPWRLRTLRSRLALKIGRVTPPPTGCGSRPTPCADRRSSRPSASSERLGAAGVDDHCGHLAWLRRDVARGDV